MTGEILFMIDILPNYELEDQIRAVAASFQIHYRHWPEMVLLHSSLREKYDLVEMGKTLGVSIETPQFVNRPSLMYVGGPPQ